MTFTRYCVTQNIISTCETKTKNASKPWFPSIKMSTTQILAVRQATNAKFLLLFFNIEIHIWSYYIKYGHVYIWGLDIINWYFIIWKEWYMRNKVENNWVPQQSQMDIQWFKQLCRVIWRIPFLWTLTMLNETLHRAQ